MTDRIQEMLDRSDLLELVNRYARGLDRCDVDQLKAVFFDDATVNMISFSGSAHAFAETTPAALRVHAVTTSHLTSNCLFEIAGDRATGESYLISISVMKDGDASKPAIHVGRYLDRFERRNGEWKIACRTIIIDLEVAGSFPAGVHALMPKSDEQRHPDDASYSLRSWLTETRG
ncbi:nuclear transport factor 2 family protein [Sphingobium sp. TB-6]|uniref:nuclear transport factor 2 family protein n=1 Tax=Sphingobium sp. TB-6 TaxID=2728850 RepID=UPI00146F1B6D|nr:nuclear transport factor 2 family protein [Sphingobium sp. TB-6]NML90648.1 nuclear transport factor 2 family protein [Sphingobium sp. TB-6]